MTVPKNQIFDGIVKTLYMNIHHLLFKLHNLPLHLRRITLVSGPLFHKICSNKFNLSQWFIDITMLIYSQNEIKCQTNQYYIIKSIACKTIL